jgi:hypothetical protein
VAAIKNNKDRVEEIVNLANFSVRQLGLRFDRVVNRVADEIESFAEREILENEILVVTLTAPIVLPSKLLAGVKQEIQNFSGQKARKVARNLCIHSNQVTLKLLNRGNQVGFHSIVFVHNPDTLGVLLLELAKKWVESGT